MARGSIDAAAREATSSRRGDAEAIIENTRIVTAFHEMCMAGTSWGRKVHALITDTAKAFSSMNPSPTLALVSGPCGEYRT
jgi:hypothetical protein